MAPRSGLRCQAGEGRELLLPGVPAPGVSLWGEWDAVGTGELAGSAGTRGVALSEPRAAMPQDVPCHPGVGAARPHPCAARVWDGELERRRCLKG